MAQQSPQEQTQNLTTSGTTAFKSGCFGGLGVGFAGVIISVIVVLITIMVVCGLCYLCTLSIPTADTLRQLSISITPNK